MHWVVGVGLAKWLRLALDKIEWKAEFELISHYVELITNVIMI